MSEQIVAKLSNVEPEAAEGIIREEITQCLENALSMEPLHQALDQIYQNSHDALNPLESTALSCISLLLSTPALLDPCSKGILSFIALHASAREVILQLDEIIEGIFNDEFTHSEEDDSAIRIFDRVVLVLKIYASGFGRNPFLRFYPRF
ncbi:uncharacterized protein EI90DRAFT_2019765 [Cantharellus anzutake]|uniref:uncharacterized protein n=1 Tax=Cantharellus anzutake TaxID=1750568 RepID=UPI001904FBDA|nr:uncharacterized protein EI90DRAFT_2019765 [Cantharellus anzutake]KAF8325812.1 hypothetical protein EI90DRAFT_2019765 [Cantharellus anzutake]